MANSKIKLVSRDWAIKYISQFLRTAISLDIASKELKLAQITQVDQISTFELHLFIR